MYGPKRPRSSDLAKDPFRKKTIFDLPEPSRSVMLRVVDIGGAYDATPPQPAYGENGRYYRFSLSDGPIRSLNQKCLWPTRRDTMSVVTQRDDQPAAYRDYAEAIEKKQERGRSTGRDPRDALIARHRYLADMLVSKFLRGNFEFRDTDDSRKREEVREALLSAAREGLARAALKFKPELGKKFYSYAWTAIWRELLAEQTKRAEWSSLISDESLDAPVGDDDGGRTRLDLAIDETGNDDPARIVDENILPHFDILTERERFVISARYLDEPRNQCEIAAELGCTSQNVSLIEKSALAKLREAITGRKPKPRRKLRQRRETPAIPEKDPTNEGKYGAALAA
jgi:RNA polymerase sigma factor (sigma-70 family)